MLKGYTFQCMYKKKPNPDFWWYFTKFGFFLFFSLTPSLEDRDVTNEKSRNFPSKFRETISKIFTTKNDALLMKFDENALFWVTFAKQFRKISTTKNCANDSTKMLLKCHALFRITFAKQFRKIFTLKKMQIISRKCCEYFAIFFSWHPH